MRYFIAGRSTIAGTAVLPQFSLFAIAAVGGKVRECGVFNTTATAVAVALARLTAAGTPGAGLTEGKYDPNGAAASMTGFAGHTVAATVGDTVRQASLGAAIGSGVIWTFGDTGIIVPVGTANGAGVIVPTGTGQVSDYHLDWDE